MVGDPYGVKVGLSMPKKERVGPNHTSCTSLAFLINLLYGRIDGCGSLMENGYHHCEFCDGWGIG
jgi:hypothetical protein